MSIRPPTLPVKSAAADGLIGFDFHTTTGVVYSVDSATNPTRVSILILNQWPPVEGYVWPSTIVTTFSEAPNPFVAPATGASYYCNRTTMTGGTIVSVEQNTRTVSAALGGYSTLAPYNYQLDYQNIKHNGATGPGGWQQPGPIDLTQLASIPAGHAAPVLTPTSPTITYPVVGNGTYDAQATFTVDTIGGVWQVGLALFAVPHGLSLTGLDVRDFFKGTVAVGQSSSGTYTAIWKSLGAGQSEDLYVAYEAPDGSISPVRLVGTTTANPIGTSGLADLSGVTPTKRATSGTLSYYNVGSAGVDAEATIHLDTTQGTTSNAALAEIEGVMVPYNRLATQGGTVTSTSDSWVASGVPTAVNGTGDYVITWGQLPAGAAMALGIRYVGHNGKRSNVLILTELNPTTIQTVGTSIGTKMPSGILSAGPTYNGGSCTLGTQVSGGATASQPFSASFADWSGSSPDWLCSVIYYVRIHGGSLVGDPITLPSSTNVFAQTAQLPAGTSLIDIGFAYLDYGNQISTKTWPAQFDSITVGAIANTSLKAMPSVIKSAGPSVTGSLGLQISRTGVRISRNCTFTETDFTTTPSWFAGATVVTRINGDTDGGVQVDVAAKDINSSGTCTKALAVYLGDTIDVGLYYTDTTGDTSAVTWFATNQADSNGDFIDTTDSNKGLKYTRQASAVRNTVQSTGGIDFVSTLHSNKNLSSIADGVASTWNPSDKDANLVLSGGNLIVTANPGGGYDPSVRAISGKSSGKWYWEITMGTVTADHFVGVMDASAVLNGYIGASVHGWGYYGNGGTKYNGSGPSAYGATFSTGDIIGVALDMDNGTLTFYKNGVSQGTAFTGLTGTLYPAATLSTLNDSMTANFGATAFVYPIPSGFYGRRFAAMEKDANNTESRNSNGVGYGGTVVSASSITQDIADRGSGAGIKFLRSSALNSQASVLPTPTDFTFDYTFPTSSAGSPPANHTMTWCVYGAGGSGGNVTFYRPDGTTVTAAAIATTAARNVFDAGATGQTIYVKFYYNPNTAVWSYTFQTSAFTPAQVAPAYGDSILALVGSYGAQQQLLGGTTGSGGGGSTKGGNRYQ